MIAKQVVDFQIDTQDYDSLPFFEKTAGSQRFLYFCRCFSPELGGEFVVITEDREGAVSQFVYNTGKIRFDTSDLLKHLEAKLGPASEANPEDADAIFDALNDYDGGSQDALDQQLSALKPLADVVRSMDSKLFDSLISTANTIEVVGVRQSIATSVDRFVVYDGEVQLDFGSYDTTNGDYDQLTKQIAMVIQQASEGAQM
jgi:hypothetical protein